MSAVLCLPACLRVRRSVPCGEAPHRNAPPPQGPTPPVRSHRRLQKARFSFCLSPSYWPSTYHAPTPTVAPYPLCTTLLAFADDMAMVTATARQRRPTAPDDTRADRVL